MFGRFTDCGISRLLGAALFSVLASSACDGGDVARRFGGESTLADGSRDTDAGGVVPGNSDAGDVATMAAGTGGGTGATPATGGTTATGGGTPGTGGTVGSGGRPSAGGAPGSGGTINSGGAPGSGGTASSGGAPGRGGATGRGGAAGGGGAPGTGGGEATTPQCQKLIADYDAELQKARMCMQGGPGKDCGLLVPAQLAGCGSLCTTYVDKPEMLEKLQKEWKDKGCTAPDCPLFVCMNPVSSTCLLGVCTDTL